ncbi:MAG: thiol:disulfide interchange protein, partial [Azoarcus sp.]|nr:thiol:disulfide interchange protein [Azoarcus sp.]
MPISIPSLTRLRLLPALFALLLALLAPLACATDPLAAEKAFPMRAHAFGPGTVEVIFDIASAYYLYGGSFHFEAKPPGVVLGAVQRPPGERKDDPFFGEVETYRGQLRMLLPVEVSAGIEHFTLSVTSQGCWDGGVCYPPTTQSVEITLAEAGSGNEEKSSEGTSANGDESGRLAGLLASAGHPLMLVSFFGLGLLLAFTPCMLPMIPVLSGIIVGAGSRVSRGRALALALAYVLGMAFTYALAGVVAGLTGSMLA